MELSDDWLSGLLEQYPDTLIATLVSEVIRLRLAAPKLQEARPLQVREGPMRVLSFDQATATTGWAFGNEDSTTRENSNNRYSFGTIKAPKRDEFGERLAAIWRAIHHLITTLQPDAIGYEEPYFPMQGAGGFKTKTAFKPAQGFLPAEVDQHQDEHAEKARFNPETLKQLQMVKGILITQAALHGIPVYGCTPSQWRVTVLGYGRAPKGAEGDYMKKAVLRKLQTMGFEVTSHDASDAIGILIHTLHGKQAAARKQGDLLDLAGGL